MIRKRTGPLKGPTRSRRRAAPLFTPAPPTKFVPESVRVSKLAEFMAEAYMLRNDVLSFRTSIDIGTDIITQHFDILKRVQVKGQAVEPKFADTFTFSTRRNDENGQKAYRANELDAFVFVHTEQSRFFIVPAAIITADRYTITFGPNSHSKWENAWWVLKKAEPI